MKKLLLLLSFLPMMASAYDAEINGIYYNLNATDITAEVTYLYEYSENPYSGEVNIPSEIVYEDVTYSVTGIGEHAFFSSTNLTSVNIPNSVKIIGQYAFSHCSRLSSIKIPKSVTSIGYSFEDCNGLTSISVDSENPVYDSRNNCNAIIETESNKLLVGCKNTKIPENVTSIGSGAFEGRSSLMSISIPSSVTSIGSSAFSGCSALKVITIPENVEAIRPYTFSECTSLVSITIPSSVKIIEHAAFWQCSNLASIEIPTSVESIEMEAFAYCPFISFTLPSSVTYVESELFHGCQDLTTISVDAENPVYDSRDNCNAIIKTESNTLVTACNNTIIPNSIKTIGDGAFSDLRILTSISIPEGVTTIGSSAFSDCSSLADITLPNSITSIGEGAFKDTEWFDKQTDGLIYLDQWLLGYKGEQPTGTLSIAEGTKGIAGNAFKFCSDLTSVSFPHGVIGISDYAFSECTGLTSIMLPASVTNIGECAFSGCTNLESICVESDNTAYDSRNDCNAIIETESNILISGCKNTVIPPDVTKIESRAFYGCSDLSTIVIPSSVTSIESYAFLGCVGLTSIISLNTENPSLSYDSFNNVDKNNCIVWVPEGCAEVYRWNYYWNEFQTINEISKGDANYDFTVDQDDLDILVAYIMGKKPKRFDKNLADLNNDNKVDAADVVLLIEILKE